MIVVSTLVIPINQKGLPGFNPVSILAIFPKMKRFSWAIWSLHCNLMHQRLSACEGLDVDWRFAMKLSVMMGQHLKTLLPCGPLPEGLNRDSKRTTNYSRWTELRESTLFEQFHF